MYYFVHPTTALEGVVNVPGSKSQTARGLILGDGRYQTLAEVGGEILGNVFSRLADRLTGHEISP